MDSNEISETLQAAKLYLEQLANLDVDIRCAEQQIINSSLETEKSISQAHSNLLKDITKVLKNRHDTFLQKARQIKDDSLKPLKECQTQILNKIKSTNSLLELGENILNGTDNQLNVFNNKASMLGSLPEVPALKEVPYISFHYDTNTEQEIHELCSNFGNVIRIAPVQIIGTTEKPGGILVEWQVDELEEKSKDIQSFRLQRAFGNMLTNKTIAVNFQDCYKGLESQFLVKDVIIEQFYSFRVCCKFEGNTEWSPWSHPHVARTNLKSFSWSNNKDYFIAGEDKIAKSLRNNASILMSNGPKFTVDNAIDFLFLEVSDEYAAVGLIISEKIKEIKDLKSATEGSFLVNWLGEIRIDGINKATRLPPFVKGLKVSFTCEPMKDNKVMIHIDSNDRRVSYEWNLGTEDECYFVTQLSCVNWTVLVE